MGGHSKWSTIKRAKALTDAKRSKVWTKIIREVTVAARLGGGDPAANPRLRQSILDAKAANMPKDNIERAIKKGAGGTEDGDYKELVYEGYGPGGVAILIECMTDNNNRTAADVRSTLTKNNGALAASNAVSRLFQKKGHIYFPQDNLSEDQILEAGLDYGLEDVQSDDESFIAVCQSADFLRLREALEKALQKSPSAAEIVMIPDTSVVVKDENARTLVKMIDLLEDLDDVQHVWTNMEVEDVES